MPVHSTLGGTNSGPISLASTGTLVLANGVKETVPSPAPAR